MTARVEQSIDSDADPRADLPLGGASRRALAKLNGGVRDPLGILEKQNAARVPDLVPLRSQRMAASPFAFYRGTAAIMAADQARDPHSGILVASCGDAHVSNFGFYASPQRSLLFDLNDFDESAWAPWEWDLKRLVTSVIVGGRASDRDDSVVEKVARQTVRGYVGALRDAMQQSSLERYYHHYEAEAAVKGLNSGARNVLRAAIQDAEKRTGGRAIRRLTELTENGTRAFVETPPVTTHVTDDVVARVEDAFEQYRRSAAPDIQVHLSQYVIDDVARRVVGVGSVGTRCYLALLRDRDGGLLILQVKQADRSVLANHGGVPQPAQLARGIAERGEGGRVVWLQRILQAYSDPFLGHLRTSTGDFYVRQFHDKKGSIEVETLRNKPFGRYATACAVVLARAHSQSPTAVDVARYIGKGRRITDSIVAWSEQYADRSLADYHDFVGATREWPVLDLDTEN